MSGIHFKHRPTDVHTMAKKAAHGHAAGHADGDTDHGTPATHVENHMDQPFTTTHTNVYHVEPGGVVNVQHFHINNPTPGPINTHLPHPVDRPLPPGHTHYPVLKVDQGRIWGDPHFIGQDGGKFDIMGESGKIYNVLSDTGVQVNAAFGPWKGRHNQTVITDMGITTEHGHKITISESGTLNVNGHALQAGNHVELSDGSRVVHNGKNVDVTAGEWNMNIQFAKNHLNVDFRSENAYSDGVLPDGLWGQTVDFDTAKRSAVDKQGTGAFTDPTKTYKDYEVGSMAHSPFSLHDNTFPKFNNYNHSHVPGHFPNPHGHAHGHTFPLPQPPHVAGHTHGLPHTHGHQPVHTHAPAHTHMPILPNIGRGKLHNAAHALGMPHAHGPAVPHVHKPFWYASPFAVFSFAGLVAHWLSSPMFHGHGFFPHAFGPHRHV